MAQRDCKSRLRAAGMPQLLQRPRQDLWASAPSVYPAPPGRAGATRAARLESKPSRAKSPAATARKQLLYTPPHAPLRKARAAPDSGSGSFRRRITAPQRSQLTLSAGRVTMLSSLPHAPSGSVPMQTAANVNEQLMLQLMGVSSSEPLIVKPREDPLTKQPCEDTS